MNITFAEPILSFRFKEFGYDPTTSGYMFAALIIPYILASPLVFLIIKKIPKRGVIILGFLFGGLISLCNGPAEFLPDKFWLLVLGFSCNMFLLPF